MKKISLPSWAFSFGPYADHPVPLNQVLEHAAQTGYDGIELSGFPPHLTLEGFSSSEQRSQLRTQITDLGLDVSGFSPDLLAANPTVPGNQDRYLDLFRRNLELARDMQCPMIRVDSGAAPGSIPEDDYAAAMDRLSDIWHRACDFGNEARIRVAWEFEPGYTFNKPTEILELHEKVGHPNFYLLFDTCHAYMCSVAGVRQYGNPETLRGGIEQMLDLSAGRIGAIHVIDSDGTLYNDETSTHTPFGEGNIDFERLGRKLRAVPGVDWWVIDLCFLPNAWELSASSLDFVRKLLQ